MDEVSASEQDTQTVLIEKDVDTFWCRKKVTELAEELGFSKKERSELSIVVSELSSNIIKFATNGSVTFGPTNKPFGIVIIAKDEGPGIDDIQTAVKDGFSEGKFLNENEGERTRGFGTGLGAIIRMMDKVTIENKKNGGFEIITLKFLKKDN